MITLYITTTQITILQHYYFIIINCMIWNLRWIYEKLFYSNQFRFDMKKLVILVIRLINSLICYTSLIVTLDVINIFMINTICKIVLYTSILFMIYMYIENNKLNLNWLIEQYNIITERIKFKSTKGSIIFLSSVY